MWIKSHSIVTKEVTKEQMWKLFADVNNWHTWDKGIEFAKLKGEFEAGNHILLRPQGGPNVKIKLTEVIENQKFLAVSKFPLARMYVNHIFEETDNGLKITIVISVKGLLSFLWVKLVAQKNAMTLPNDMQEQINHAKNMSIKLKDNTFSIDKAEDSPGFLLWQVTTIWQRKIKHSLEQYGLTHTQYVLLASLHWLTLHYQEVTQIVLSQYAKIDPMTTSAVLKTLQKKGFIRRQEHPIDTRAKKIDITNEGKEVIKKAIVTVETTDVEFFSLLNDKTKTLNELLIILIE